MIKMLRLLLLFFCFSGVALAQAPRRQANQPMEVDRIVAVVNEDVITLYELNTRLGLAINQLKRQGTELPPREVLEKQMLERMVMDKVQLQFAQSSGLRVDDAQLEQALQRIAESNKMSVGQLREALMRDGIPFAKFREEVRQEMTIGRIREREVESKIVVSESDIDNYLTGVSSANSNQEYEVAHILLRAPEAASPEELQQLKTKADQVFDLLKKGEDFARLAASYSDAPDGLQGGSLGWRPMNRLPGAFSDVVAKLNVGEVAPVFRSPNGFHIVKLVSKRGGANIPAVQQTHVRHILIKVNEVVSETDALHKLTDLQERIKYGAKFAELARLFSQDTASATKGGDLGWVYPGDTVPEFEAAMSALQPGQLSQPVRSPFGFHLIEVLERRVQDVSSERKREMARQALTESKLDEAYQDWLRQTRDRAYVELRLEER